MQPHLQPRHPRGRQTLPPADVRGPQRAVDCEQALVVQEGFFTERDFHNFDEVD